MTSPKSQFDRMKSILREVLQGHASRLLLERLEVRLQGMNDDPADRRECIDAIRTAVRMFVDEGLADEVHARLMAEAGLSF